MTKPIPFTDIYVPMRPTLSMCAVVLLLACGTERRPETSAPPVRTVETPAGEGSGEPNLSTSEDAVLLSWLERAPQGGHDLWYASLGPEGLWSERRRVVHGDSLFVNWADFPSVTKGGDGRVWAHWLVRRAGQGLAYDIAMATSSDGGETWSDLWTPHEDGTPTEHGFVSVLPTDEGVDVAWLDGRGYAPGPGGEPALRQMSVRHRRGVAGASAGPEFEVDGRTCDCCQTDVARTDRGLVLVYRDRTMDEVRDIYIAREVDGAWTEGAPVHEDGWVIAGCPVNGPAVDADADRVAVAWFTGAGDAPRVNVAFSDDAGATFGTPVRVDAGDPAGRVDLRLRSDGTALVTWLERTGGDGAELRLAAFGPDGAIWEPVVVSTSSSARASGFPRMVIAPWNPDEVVIAWTDVTDSERAVVRAARVSTPR